MTIKLIIFDFDGTIADTHDAFVRIVNSLAAEFGYHPVSLKEVEELKKLSAEEIVKNSGIPSFKIPFILRRIKQELNKEIDSLQPIDDIKSQLAQLNKMGYQMGIITSNLQENVAAFLTNNQLNHLFDFIYTGITLFGKHRIINRVLKQNYLQAEEAIYVGDETRDITAAQKSKIKVIAVGWGFNSPAILARYQPDGLIYHPQELVEVIKNLELFPSKI